MRELFFAVTEGELQFSSHSEHIDTRGAKSKSHSKQGRRESKRRRGKRRRRKGKEEEGKEDEGKEGEGREIERGGKTPAFC